LPFIAWGPGLIPASRVDDATVMAAVDLFPTLCRIAGAPLPDGYAPDGEDRSAALLGTGSPTRSRPLFWEYGRNGESFSYPSPRDRSPNVAVLEGDRKLLVNADGSGAELYDLARDPGETTDRAVDEPELARRLTDAALAWRKAMP
jgi:arylsulfatase A-like enzyme